MAISIDFSSPVIRIPGYETKYDFVGASNSFIKVFNNYLKARIIQQFHYWLWMEQGGVIIFGFKWIYKAIIKLMNEAVVGFSEYHVKKAISELVAEGILIREQLHREHYGAVHAMSAYNRQYYYRIDYDVLTKYIQSQINSKNLQIIKPKHSPLNFHPDQLLTLETAISTETAGLVNVANQICDVHQSDLRMSQINTDTTFKTNRSNTLPPTPQISNTELAREQPLQNNSVQTPDIQTKKQELIDSPDVCQNTTDSKPTPFTDVVARPPRVEQKINKNRIVQNLVLGEPEAVAFVSPVEESPDPAVVPENIATDVNTPTPPLTTAPAPSKRPARQRKVPKGTKPRLDFGLAPWSNLEQFKKFYRALIASAYVRRMAKSLEALVNRIVNELKQGVPHPFWDDFIAGREIGSSTRQEWQMPDGSPHPDFIEYLAEKLIRGNNTQTREIAICEALRIAKDPEQARFFWKECKVSLVNAKAQTERDLALGVSTPVTPTWTRERVEPTIEEAAAASMEIKGINQQTTMAIEAARNPQAQLSGDSKRPIAPSNEEATATADPWLEDKPKRKKSIRETYAELHGRIDRIPRVVKSKKVRGRRADLSSKLDIKDLDIAQINKALADPVLNADLTPQIMKSDYILITDQFGRITGVKPPI